MTEETTPPPAAAPEATAPKDRSTKAFWASVGIGSAALAAALLYAKRPGGKKSR